MSWASLRREILHRDDYTCQYCFWKPCREQMWTYRFRRWRSALHVDHVYPISLGGTNDRWNLVAACESCNLTKGAKVWLPRRVRCTWCNAAYVDVDPASVTITEFGVFHQCEPCVVAEIESEREALALQSETEEFSDLALEQRWYDRLIAAGWDVA